MYQRKPGNSVFLPHLSRDEVWAMVQETLNNPDSTRAHRSHAERRVYKKNFPFPVGVDGRSRTLCCGITIIYDVTNQRVVAAFPCI